MFNVWCEGVQYGGLRGIMRHLEHLPRYSATFTSIHIVSTLILDVREFILDFFWYFWNILRSCHIHLNTYCVNIAMHWYWLWERILFLFLEHLEIPRLFVGLRMKYSIPLLFQEKTFNFLSLLLFERQSTTEAWDAHEKKSCLEISFSHWCSPKLPNSALARANCWQTHNND